MSASRPPAPNLLSSVRAAASAEEIFALLGVGYDPKVLNVARLHILKRMSAHLA
ncbi:MAG: nitrogenase-stabilizing/protective protein NifW, partial [Rhodoplanes sp.]